MEKKNKLRLLLIPLVLVLLAAAAYIGWKYYVIHITHTSVEPKQTGEWFELAPDGAVCGDGSPLSTRMRLGKENKVIVIFYGGGISFNEYTAARPYIGFTVDAEPGFYSSNAEDQIPYWCNMGIGDSAAANPFRNWTIVVIPYATGDFHIGNAEFPYTAADGTEAVLLHHGYDNYRAIMEEAMGYITEQPEELLVAGWSAGGYGAAMLTEDLMQNYFPDAGHVTLCVDSSLLVLDDWTEIFSEVWNASDIFTDKIRSDNLIVDFMSYLYETYGDRMTFLYVGSVRDGALAKYQTFFDIGVYAADNRNVSVYTAYLRVMIRQLQKKIPTIGIYLFDNLPFSLRPNQFWLTQHTILETRTFFWRLTDRISVAVWLDQAVRGNVSSHGLYKLW